MNLLEQRLDRELERKKKLEEQEQVNNKDEVRIKKLKSDEKDATENVNQEQQQTAVSKNEEKRITYLDQLKEEFNQISSKKSSLTKKKKKAEPTKIKLSDEDNLDLKLDKTISIALPASIILNAQTSELKAYLIGQIARCAAIFNVNEIVVFDEYCTNGDYYDEECEDDKVTCVRQMVNILRYLECPQYLRKSLFPLHKDFRSAGVINPLDTKHHLRFEDESEFREGRFIT